MDANTWVAFGMLVIMVIGLVVGIARWIGSMDRLKDAVERLTDTMNKTSDVLEDHEHRITILETRSGQ